jgi:hypothetical protein
MVAAQSITFYNTSSTAGAATKFYGVGGCDTFPLAAEASIQVKFISGGVLSNLWIRLKTNTTTADSTATTRVNTAAGAQTITLTHGVSGTFTDAVNTDNVATTNLIAVRIVVGTGGSITPSIIATMFAATTNTVTPLCYNYNQITVSTASTSFFIPIGGSNDAGANTTTEGNTQTRQRKSGTYQNATIDISANTRAQASTFTGRLNGGAGAITKSITGNTTGLFSDTTNTDAVVAGNDYNLAITTGTGTGNNGIDTTFIEFLSSASIVIHVCANHTQMTQNANLTRFYGLGGTISTPASTESEAQGIAGVAYTYSELTINLITNTVSADSTLTLRAGAADVGSISATLTASTTGVFSDSTHTYAASASDLMNTKVLTGATGTSMKANVIVVWGSSAAVGGVSVRPRTQAINLSKYITMDLGSELALGAGNQGGII